MHFANSMKHICEKCSQLIDQIIQREGIPNLEEIAVPQWVGGKHEIPKIDFEALLSELAKQILKFSEYACNITQQAKQLRQCKDNLKSNEILLQTDFVQNYQIKHQNEVKVADWKSDQDLTVTIYAGAIYY